MRKTYINFYGAPGSGKSTAAAMMYSYLKLSGKDVGLVREYATELIEQRGYTHEQIRADQWVICHNQIQRELSTNRSIIVTDSPYPIGIFYGRKYKDFTRGAIKDLEKVAQAQPRLNVNIFMEKSATADHATNGRVHSKDEAMEINREMRKFVESRGAIYKTLYKDDLMMNFSSIVDSTFRIPKE